MIRLARALLYRRRYLASRDGLGVLLQRVHHITGRTDYFWSWPGDEPAWQPFPVEMLGRLTLCTVRSQVEELLAGGRP